jgi:hypothetical protein
MSSRVSRFHFISLLLLALGIACKDGPLSPEQVELQTLVTRGDSSALKAAQQLGPKALPALLPLAQHPTSSVRALALECLGRVGGSKAELAIATAFSDADGDVRLQAARFLPPHPGPDAHEPLLAAVQQGKDAYTRRNAAFAYANSAKASKGKLADACAGVQESEARLGCTVGLAKLGEPKARAEFTQKLSLAQGNELDRLLTFAESMYGPWLVKALLPVLDNRAASFFVGVDGFQVHKAATLRACDRALNGIVTATGVRFSFEIDDHTQYTDAQLSEAKAYASKLASDDD